MFVCAWASYAVSLSDEPIARRVSIAPNFLPPNWTMAFLRGASYILLNDKAGLQCTYYESVNRDLDKFAMR